MNSIKQQVISLVFIGFLGVLLPVQAMEEAAGKGRLAEYLLGAVFMGDEHEVRSLLNQKAEVNGVGKHGMTPLVAAIQGGHDAVAVLLLKRGASPCPAHNRIEKLARYSDSESACADDRDRLIFFEASESSYSDSENSEEMALQNGEDSDRYSESDASDEGEIVSPLEHAIVLGKDKLVRQLLKYGAAVNGVLGDAQMGVRPLALASCIGSKKVVEILLKGKADVTACDRFGHMACDIAQLYKHIQVVELLRKAEKERSVAAADEK